MVNEMVSRNDLIVLNLGHEPTFRRGIARSIIDLTISTLRLASKITDWRVLEETTLSDHRCIEFSIGNRRTGISGKRGNKRPSWNTRRLSKDKLRDFLEETRLTDELGWVKSAEPMESTVRLARQRVIAACDHSMPRLGQRRAQGSRYWWNDTLSGLRSACNAARRKTTRSIRRSQLKCWRDLIEEVEKDPWGLAFKIVTKKLVTRRRTPDLHDPDQVRKIVRPCFHECNHSRGRTGVPAQSVTSSSSLSRN